MSDTQHDRPTIAEQLGLGHLAGSVRQGIRIGLAVSGVAALVIGILLTFWTGQSLTAIAILFGLYFVVTGVVSIAIGAFATAASGSTRALNIIFGVFLTVVGVISMKNIEATLLAIVMIVGIGWIVEGVLAMSVAGGPGRGWSIAFGVISVVAGIVVLLTPGLSLITLALVGGISLIVIGVAQLVRAITFGSARRV